MMAVEGTEAGQVGLAEVMAVAEDLAAVLTVADQHMTPLHPPHASHWPPHPSH